MESFLIVRRSRSASQNGEKNKIRIDMKKKNRDGSAKNPEMRVRNTIGIRIVAAPLRKKCTQIATQTEPLRGLFQTPPSAATHTIDSSTGKKHTPRANNVLYTAG